jgi:RNA polymerase sigma factor (TIGR02999 family)
MDPAVDSKALIANGFPLPDPIAAALAALREGLSAGRPGSLDDLVRATQDELRRIARRERRAFDGGETLSTTALVNEAYLRIAGSRLPDDVDRRLWFGIAARVMRQVLVDHARATHAAKRGGGLASESLSAAAAVVADERDAVDLVALDQALEALAAANARAAEVVQLRYFAGLGDREIADLLAIDESTVRRDWLKARGWLHRRLADPAR